MIYFYLIICFVLYLIIPNNVLWQYGVTANSLWHAFSYPFAHASILHWLVNTIAIITMWAPICNLYIKRFYHSSITSPVWIRCRLFLMVYMGAVLASLFTATDIPTIGASGLVFFLLGMLIALNPTKKQIIAFIPVAISICLQTISEHSNIVLHIVSFAFGVLSIIIKVICEQKNI